MRSCGYAIMQRCTARARNTTVQGCVCVKVRWRYSQGQKTDSCMSLLSMLFVFYKRTTNKQTMSMFPREKEIFAPPKSYRPIAFSSVPPYWITWDEGLSWHMADLLPCIRSLGDVPVFFDLWRTVPGDRPFQKKKNPRAIFHCTLPPLHQKIRQKISHA